MKLNRSQKLLVTTEARVLKILREAKGMTMQQAADAIGKSKPYIAHIEGGRMAVPRGDKLMRLLNAYGITNPRSFEARVRDYAEVPQTYREQLQDFVKILPNDRIDILLRLAKALAEGKVLIIF